MNSEVFVFERNGWKVYKIGAFYIMKKGSKRYIRATLSCINQLIDMN